MQNSQSAVLTAYGTGGVAPLSGATMGGISTGKMRDINDAGYSAPNPGTDFATPSLPPATYLAAHGGNLPPPTNCSGICPAGTGANDPIDLRLTIRVPTNATSFTYRYRYFSADYPSVACTAYADWHLALLTSGAPGIPTDMNIAFDSMGNTMNSSAFFDVCATTGCNTCPLGTAALAGTGTTGGTAWLAVTAPVIPGETIDLDLMVFDVGDGFFDSLVLLDNFVWNP